MGQRAENIEGADLIIYTAAIMADNPELIAAKASSAVCCERAEILGLVTSWYSNALCVSGTHGKTTTSSMLTQIFVKEGVDLPALSAESPQYRRFGQGWFFSDYGLRILRV